MPWNIFIQVPNSEPGALEKKLVDTQPTELLATQSADALTASTGLLHFIEHVEGSVTQVIN